LLAAFALGAEGAQMGTRMLASIESGVHDNVKDAVLRASETDTTLLNRHNRKPMRVLRSDLVNTLEADAADPVPLLLRVRDTYERGDLEASIQQLGQVAGRITEILPVTEIIRRTMSEFEQLLGALAERHLSGTPAAAPVPA
jgi:enoyl-[acyl-carrier protein] reductase II